MQVLEVLGEVVDALGVQELADDVAGLQLADGLPVLGDRRVKVVLRVQVVCMAAPDAGNDFGSCLRTLPSHAVWVYRCLMHPCWSAPYPRTFTCSRQVGRRHFHPYKLHAGVT